jgi:crotonobetainyl-CoA:carnitine CoA-transferase CaiB-like acyl-CoA transferase
MALQAHVFDGLSAGRAQQSSPHDGVASDPAGRREGRPVWGPLDRPVECPDGSLVVSIDDDLAFRRLCDLAGVDGSDGPRAVVEARLAEQLRDGPAGKWEELLVDAGVPCAVASTDLAALHGDPRVASLFEPLSDGCSAPASPWVPRK